jgi:hypothetical protein
MIGLTDRLEPWTRRFQRPPVLPAAEPEPEPAAPWRERTGRFDRAGGDEPAEPRAGRTGRLARRSLQERDT